jgi:hypothetical protein
VAVRHGSAVDSIDILRHATLNIYAETADQKIIPPEILPRMVAAGDPGRQSRLLLLRSLTRQLTTCVGIPWRDQDRDSCAQILGAHRICARKQ